MGAEYVVVGAGITGLYTAFELIHISNVDPKKITLIAQYHPGDQSTYYTSPWAGGNFSGITPADDDVMEFDRYTYTHLSKVQEELGGAKAGLDYRPSTELWDFLPNTKKYESLKSYMKDFRSIPNSELPAGVKFGSHMTIWNFNCPLFLQTFYDYLKSKGVSTIRQKLSHISQAFLSSETKVVFNCTGLGARSLGGVKDTKVYPTRGQVVVIRAPHINENKMHWAVGHATYIIPRPNSNGELVLGGYLQKDNETGDTFSYETEDILKRTTALLPKILDKPLEIIRVVAGLRPSRHGGVRIELEEIEDSKIVVHNYGAGGYGYQAGLGMAFKAVSLLNEYKKQNRSKL